MPTSISFPCNGVYSPNVLTTVEKIFDPRINRLWEMYGQDTGHRVLTLSEYIKIVKAIWTPENLAQPSLRGFLIPGLYDSVPSNRHQQFYDTFIRNLPPELVWGVAFMQVKDFSSSAVAIKHYFVSSVYEGPAFNEFSVDSLSSGTPGYALDATGVVIFTDHLRSCIEKWTTKANEFDGRVSRNSVAGSAHSSILRGIMYFALDTQVLTVNGTNKSPSRVATMLSDPETVFSYPVDLLLNGTLAVRAQVSQTATATNRSAIYEVFGYNGNPCNYIKWPMVRNKEHKPVLYGIELECATDYEAKDLIDAAAEPFFIIKTDSSVNGAKRNKFELVTVPCSLKQHRYNYAMWFRKLDYSKFDTSTKTNNGMHVHIDRTAFDDDNHIKRMTWFYNNPANVEFIVQLSERGSREAMNSYTPLVNFGGMNKKVDAYKSVVALARGIRGTVNVATNKPTVEIRLFRGIVSYASVVKNLEAVDAIFWFTREHQFKELTFKGFHEWLIQTPANKYSILKKFLDSKELPLMLATAEVNDVLFGVKDPQRMAEMIKKSVANITEFHITAMNRGRKRTFILNKATRDIDVVERDKGKMAFLDRVLESKYVPRETQ